ERRARWAPAESAAAIAAAVARAADRGVAGGTANCTAAIGSTDGGGARWRAHRSTAHRAAIRGAAARSADSAPAKSVGADGGRQQYADTDDGQRFHFLTPGCLGLPEGAGEGGGFKATCTAPGGG